MAIDFNQFKPSSLGGPKLNTPPSAPRVTPTPGVPSTTSIQSQLQPTPAPKPLPIATTPQAASVQNKIFTGPWWRKALDVPQVPAYAFSGFLKGGYDEIDRQKAAGVNTKGVGPVANLRSIAQRFGAGIKNIPAGIRSRASSFDANPADRLGIKNPAGQFAYNLGV